MKPRILHVIKTLELGGAETNLRNLQQAFDHGRFEHHIAYSFGGEIETFFKKNPIVKLFRFSRGKHKSASFMSLVIIARLWWYILSKRIRIVHTHNFNAHFWGAYAAKLAGAKVVEHVHDFRYVPIDELERRKDYVNMNRHINKFKGLSDIIVVLTEQNRRFVIEHGFRPPDKVRIIPNGIPMPGERASTKAELAREFGFAADAPVVLVTSRMMPTKNIELVLRTAPSVLREVPEAIYLIAGDGKHLEEYKKEADAKKLRGAVRFIGFQSDVYRLLCGCDVFFLPSFLELHSISILEAMSVGKPVVASSNVGCNSEVFTHGEDGFLHDPFSDTGWAETLVRLLKDPALREAVGKSGQELCRKRFDIRVTARAFEALYEELEKRAA